MTAFRITRETRERLERFNVVVGVATQPTWLRWDYMAQKAAPRRADSPWEVKLYPNVPFPTINSESLAVGFGDTPDEAVERALGHPTIRYRSRLDRALFELTNELRMLEWSIRWAIERHQRGMTPRTFSDDLDDDIPF